MRKSLLVGMAGIAVAFGISACQYESKVQAKSGEFTLSLGNGEKHEVRLTFSDPLAAASLPLTVSSGGDKVVVQVHAVGTSQAVIQSLINSVQHSSSPEDVLRLHLAYSVQGNPATERADISRINIILPARSKTFVTYNGVTQIGDPAITGLKMTLPQLLGSLRNVSAYPEAVLDKRVEVVREFVRSRKGESQVLSVRELGAILMEFTGDRARARSTVDECKACQDEYRLSVCRVIRSLGDWAKDPSRVELLKEYFCCPQNGARAIEVLR